MYTELTDDLIKLAKTDSTFRAIVYLCHYRGDTYTKMLECSIKQISFQKRMLESSIIRSKENKVNGQYVHL